jgi:hypothetical protein
MSKVRAVVCLLALALACSEGAYSANCSCWGGGAIVGLLGSCANYGGTGIDDDCDGLGGTLYCTHHYGCSPDYYEACCPSGTSLYYGCRNGILSGACCSESPTWCQITEGGAWVVCCS